MTLQRLIVSRSSRQSERWSVYVDVARTEAADVELTRMIERRSRNARKAGRAGGKGCYLCDLGHPYRCRLKDRK
jgi:hypothetical protein